MFSPASKGKQHNMKKIFIVSCAFILSLFTTSLFAQEAIKVKQISKKGNPILFLPHVGCASQMWEGIAKNYAATNSCYLVDFAGFAGMKPIKENYTENYVNALVAYIYNNKLENSILVGQNYGAYVATLVAKQIPGKIKAIIASDFYPKLSMVLGKDIDEEKLNTIVKSMKENIIAQNDSSFKSYQIQIAKNMNFMDSNYVETFVDWQMKSDRKTISETLAEQLADNLLPYYETNKIPTLVFSTWYFAITFKNLPISEAVTTLGGMYPQAKNITHKVTDQAKDFIPNDAPEWFIEEVNQFLKANN